MKQDELIKDWLATETSSTQRSNLERAIEMSEGFSVPASLTKDQSWESFQSKLGHQTSFIISGNRIPTEDHQIKPQGKARILTMLIGVAAMLLAAYVAYFSPLNSPETVIGETGLAENKMLVLPAGSKVTLNAASSVNYSLEDWYENRVVDLSGEAYFDVTKGVEFLVKTKNGEVKVLGTSFNVFSRDEEFSVECFTGRVLVSTETEAKELGPGQKVELVNNSLVLTQAGSGRSATWRTGEFYFDAVALKDVIKEMERQFDIEFNVKSDISDRYYSGFFSRNNLKEALQLVFVPMGLGFEINDGKVIVR